MIKTNIKLQVTPEQSEAVQKICFANGVFWYAGNGSEVKYTEAKYLFIDSDRVWFRVITEHNIGTETEGYTEVDTDLFIKTNGTCEEDKKEIDLRNTWCYATVPTHNKLRLLGYDHEPIEYCKDYYYIDNDNSIVDLNTKPQFKPNFSEVVLNEQGKFEFNINNKNPSEIDADGLLVKAFGKKYILEPKEIEAIKKSETAYPSSKLPKLKPYSKISSQKAECQFVKYGFEKPDFECVILTKIKDEFIGYIIKQDTRKQDIIIATTWSKDGIAYLGSKRDIKYYLQPIKKPWYETCKFPILVWDEDNDLLAIRTRGEYSASYLDTCKPLTNNEIEELKQ